MGPLSKYLRITVGGGGSFKILTYYSCCLGDPLKAKYLYCTLQFLQGPLWRQSAYTLGYIFHWGPLWKSTYTLQLVLVAPSKAEYYALQWLLGQSRHHGGFGGLRPLKQSSKPPSQIETWNTIYQWSFCQFLECQAPHAQTQSPPIENFLATVLFGDPLENRVGYLQYLWCASEYIIWVDSKFFTKMKNNYARNTSRGLKNGGPEASASLASL